MTRIKSLSPDDLYEKSVFINCPFDNEFLPHFHAILFAVYDCGFLPRHALEESEQHELRLEKIYRLINESRRSIHDLSRVELSTSGLPRFNMPFECGLAYGAMKYGDRSDRKPFVMTAVAYDDKKAISDLAGTDPGYHNNEVPRVIALVREFLFQRSNSITSTRFLGARKIHARLRLFQAELRKASISKKLSYTVAEVSSMAYLNVWTAFAHEWININPE